ncbi:MAG TPA: Glu/Leu/Phe/Val dehydrogenase [Ktedonobacterales bacterium]|nr:Glu/Leu/Phe/Val dehydrogenase [Ktedonobacterales bacterium]
MVTISGGRADKASSQVVSQAQATSNTNLTEASQLGASPDQQSAHEQVVFCNDAASGLRAIIAIYSTALGPGLGGTRFYPYLSDEAAIADVLNLSRAMAYKNALAGLDFGGGKAVIIGDPGHLKSEALLRAYGRFVQSLGGRYVTACDVGTYSQDMDIVARECRYAVGRTQAHGGSGDSSVLTALGVFQGMRAAAEHTWGTPDLDGRLVAIEGIGKVGSHLVGHLVSDGAKVLVYDVNASATASITARHPGVIAATTREDLISGPIDVYAPCALGGALDDETASTLQARIVCGGANNQLAHPGIGQLLHERGIVYAPDYVVNAGGVIQVADELQGFSFERAKLRAMGIFETTRQILAVADKDGVVPGVAADRLAERRMSEIGRLKGIWLPR